MYRQAASLRDYTMRAFHYFVTVIGVCGVCAFSSPPQNTEQAPVLSVETNLVTLTLFDPDDHDARPRILKRLAHETGGEVFTPRHASDVVRSFEQIARELRSGYTIGIQPSEMADGGFRSIRVVVDAGGGRQLVARTRAGYYAGQ